MAETSTSPKPRRKGDEAAVLKKIAAMREPYRAMGERLHEIITRANPELTPRLWYGMPGYAKSAASPVLCFFRADTYMTFGLTEKAHFSRDESADHQLMANAWFFTGLDEATEAKIAEIVRKGTA